MRFHFHWYPAPRLLFFQFTRGIGIWHIRIGHTQWDVIFRSYDRKRAQPYDRKRAPRRCFP